MSTVGFVQAWEKRLSNGQWVDYKAFVRDAFNKKASVDEVREVLGSDWLVWSNKGVSVDDVVDVFTAYTKGTQIPALTSLRMTGEHIIEYRTENNLPLTPDKAENPRIFAGVFEAEGFESAPLRDVYIIIVKQSLFINGESAQQILERKAKQYHGLARCDAESDLIRVSCIWGEDLARDLKELGVSPVRVYVARRRELCDLPNEFVRELSTFYLNFLWKSLSAKMNSVLMFVPKSEVSALINEWIIKLIRRYDENSGVPFGAYLVQTCRKWIYTLGKNVYGSRLHAYNTKINKARRELEALGDTPTTQDIANYMNMPVDKVESLIEEIDAARQVYSPSMSLDTPVDDSHSTPSETLIVAEDDGSALGLILSRCLLDCRDEDIFRDVYRSFFLEQGKPSSAAVEWIRGLAEDSDLLSCVRVGAL